MSGLGANLEYVPKSLGSQVPAKLRIFTFCLLSVCYKTIHILPQQTTFYRLLIKLLCMVLLILLIKLHNVVNVKPQVLIINQIRLIPTIVLIIKLLHVI